jgi:imidazolonepropionase-like amidohydrolase
MCSPGSNNPIGGQNFVMKVYGHIATFVTSEGLNAVDALKCITINGTEILGCDNKLG